MMDYNMTNQSRANLPEAKKGNGFTIFVAIVTAIVVFSVGMFGYSFYQNTQAKAHFEQVRIVDAMEKVKNDENTVVIIGSKTCSHCLAYKPVAQDYAKTNGTKFYYVDLTEGTNEADMRNNPELAVTGTPTTYYFHKGVKVNASEGERTLKEIQQDVDVAKEKGFSLPKS